MKFSKYETEQVMNKLRNELKKIGVELNLNISGGTARYGDEITFKVTVSKNAETEFGTVKMDKKAIEFQKRASGMGLRKELLGEPIVSPKGTYVITGYNTRAKSYPIEYTKDGAHYKSSVNSFMGIIREFRPEYVV